MTLRQKVISLAFVSMFLILLANFYIFSILNTMNEQIEVVYTDNTNLKELREKLANLELSVDEYVSNRSTEAIEAYYRDDEALREQIEKLNNIICDDPILLAEKNIRGMAESYLGLAADIIQAKRGRNVEKYGAVSEKARLLCRDIDSCIEALNGKLFTRSSEKYVGLIQQMRELQAISMALLVLTMIGNIFAVTFMTGKLMQPLKALTDAANTVTAGNLEVEELEIRNLDEVGIVTDAFNKMLASIRNYIHQLQETMEREAALKEEEFRMQGYLREAQLKYLQAQIKPHFLFNTLNAGVQLAMMEDAEKTQELLENTAAFYRYNVRKVNQSATIREEIGMVDAYIYISKVRFGDSFVFEKDVDESLLEQKIPSMILQPLVENAFKYGIKDLESIGRIELTVQRYGDKIQISIWDNGVGIEKERLEEIMNGQSAVNKERGDSNGVGMRNVRERLKLFFETQAAFSIVSEGMGMGTEIVITIPEERK